MAQKWIYVLVAIALLAAGWLDWSLRAHWEKSAAIQHAVAALDTLPDRVGDWSGEPISLDEIIVQIAACAGYKSYRYINDRTGHAVDVTVMVGIPGQMAEHTPEACYTGAGYTLERRSWTRVPASQFLGEGVQGELARMDFLRGDHPRPTRVWHSWFDGERWQRPDYPRLAFVARPMLCRFQASATLAPDLLGDDPNRLIDPAEEFLREFLPVVTQALSPESPTTASGEQTQ